MMDVSKRNTSLRSILWLAIFERLRDFRNAAE